MKKKTGKILICPMDWGLGHATRCVPIIENLLEAGVDVVIGADNKPLDFLRMRFPELSRVRLEGYEPEYQKHGPLALKVAADIPKMSKIIKPVQKKLEKIIKEYQIDAVISDNRYELSSKQVPTVFMTHQLNILTQGLLVPFRSAIQKFLYHFIEKFDELWIPDFKTEPNISGTLSHVSVFPDIPHYYIGTITRFEKLIKTPPLEKELDILCIMSGPEPQRTILEKLLKEQLLKTNFKTIILSGKPDKNERIIMANVQLFSHASDEEMAGLIRSADLIISRSGYTTLMDLAVFGKKGFFIPTPGQPEQEYLANKLMETGNYFSTVQSKLNLVKNIPEAMSYPGLTMHNDYSMMKKRIEQLLKRI